MAEAALVGPTGSRNDPIVAVIVPRGESRPTLRELRDHLEEHGQDPRFLPQRLETIAALPKTATGKVRKVELRELLA